MKVQVPHIEVSQVEGGVNADSLCVVPGCVHPVLKILSGKVREEGKRAVYPQSLKSPIPTYCTYVIQIGVIYNSATCNLHCINVPCREPDGYRVHISGGNIVMDDYYSETKCVPRK